MLANYVPVLIFLLVAMIFGAAMLLVGRVMGPHISQTLKNCLPMNAVSKRSKTVG